MGGARRVVQIDVDRASAELAADALWRAGPSAVLEVELGPDLVRLTADVADLASIDAAWAPTVLEVDDDGYLDAWRTWAAPIRVGRRVVLHPAWLERAAATGDDLVVDLDPGRAFGSGSHESTRLAVAAIEAHLCAGDRVLDVGCGSGVLAVVACLLGAELALAIDVEPEALDATTANAARNGVADRVAVDRRSLAEVDGTFDLVVANIGGSVLFDLAPDLAARVSAGGRLVLAGILDERADALAAAVPGCTVVGRATESGWASLVLHRTGDRPTSVAPPSGLGRGLE